MSSDRDQQLPSSLGRCDCIVLLRLDHDDLGQINLLSASSRQPMRFANHSATQTKNLKGTQDCSGSLCLSQLFRSPVPTSDMIPNLEEDYYWRSRELDRASKRDSRRWSSIVCFDKQLIVWYPTEPELKPGGSSRCPF